MYDVHFRQQYVTVAKELWGLSAPFFREKTSWDYKVNSLILVSLGAMV